MVDAGFILQIDDPGVMTSWDMIKPEPTIAEYRRYLKRRIDALNHALAGIPEDRVRHHFCWGSWHGAHTHDLPLKEIIDLALEVRAQACSFEAGNVRHQHEWTLWKDVKLPAGKIIVPGVVSHAPRVSRSASARRQAAILAWSPESRISGIGRPSQTCGRV